MEALDDPVVITRMAHLGAAVLAVWLFVGASVYLAFRGKAAAAKRRLVPPWATAAGAVAIAGGLGMGAILAWSPLGAGIAGGIALIAVVATLGNIRNLKFCDTCAATRYELPAGPRLARCPRCGASLDGSPVAGNPWQG